MATDLNKTLNLEDAINNLDTLIKKVELLNDSLTSFSKTTEESKGALDGLNKAQEQSDDIIKDTVKASEELEKIKKQNLKTEQQLANAYSYENQELISNKIKLQEANKEVRNDIKNYTERIKQKEELNNALTQEAKTIAEAQKQNKALRKEVKELDTTTAEGQAKIEEYNKIIDQNSKLIKENSDSYVQQKIQIGDYTIALDDVKGGFVNLGKQMKAFFMNPWALAITAIVGAFTALYDALNSTEEGQVLLAKTTGFLNGVLLGLNEVVIRLTKPIIALFEDPRQAIENLKTDIEHKIIKVWDDLTKLATSVGKVLKGVFTLDENLIAEGAEEAVEAFTDLVKETNIVYNLVKTGKEIFEDVIDTGKQLSDIEVQRELLQQSRNKLIIDEAELSRDIAEYRRIAADSDVKSREQLEAIQKAEELTRELTGRKLADKKEELRLLMQEQGLGHNNLQDNKEAAQLQAEIIKLQEQQSNQLRTLQRQRTSILNTIEKEKELEGELSELRTEVFYEEQARRGLIIQQSDEDLQNAEDSTNRRLDLEKILTDGKLEQGKSVAQSSADLAGELFESEKAGAYARAGINIAEGITKAISSKGILGVAEGVLITAAGAVQLAKIAGTNAYYKGTEHAQKGLAWIAERGAELVEGKNGRLTLVPDLSLIDLQGGEKIHTAEETKKMLFDDTRIVRELRRQKQTVIVNINKDTFNSKYRMKA